MVLTSLIEGGKILENNNRQEIHNMIKSPNTQKQLIIMYRLH